MCRDPQRGRSGLQRMKFRQEPRGQRTRQPDAPGAQRPAHGGGGEGDKIAAKPPPPPPLHPHPAPGPQPAQAFHSLLSWGKATLDHCRLKVQAPPLAWEVRTEGTGGDWWSGRAVARDPGPPSDQRSVWSPPAVCAAGQASPGVMTISPAHSGLVRGPRQQRGPRLMLPSSDHVVGQREFQNRAVPAAVGTARAGFPYTAHCKLLLQRAFSLSFNLLFFLKINPRRQPQAPGPGQGQESRQKRSFGLPAARPPQHPRPLSSDPRPSTLQWATETATEGLSEVHAAVPHVTFPHPLPEKQMCEKVVAMQ